MRYLAWLTLPFVAGIVLGCLVPAWWLCLLLAVIVVPGGVLLRRKWQEGRLAATLAMIGLCFGLVWFGGYTALFVQPTAVLHGQESAFEATVLTYSTETDWGSRVVVRLEDGVASGRKVRLSLVGDWSHLQPGDRVTGTGKFTSAAEENLRWCVGDGIFLQAVAEEARMYRQYVTPPWWYLPQMLGQKLKETMDALLSEPSAALLRALLTGDTSKLSDNVSSDFARSGMSHLLAVSGLHVGFLVAFLTRRPGSHRWHGFFIVPMLALFALMIGGGATVWRSVIMMSMVILAPLLGREVDPFTSLCAALLVLLIHNPYAIQSVSLQLSFAAVAGLAWFYPGVYAFLARPAKKHLRLERVWKWVARSIAVSSCASIGSLPVLAWHFGELSLIGPVSNLFCLWLGTVSFGLGLITCLMAWVYMPLARICVLFLELMLEILAVAAEFFAGGTYSALSMDNPYYKLWLGALCLLVVAMVAIKPLARRPIMPLGAMAALLFLALTLRLVSVSNVAFSVTALDVGQGSCTVFASRGNFVAVDCGGSDAGDALSNYVQGDGRVDLLVLSHYDSDHVDGLEQLLRRTEVSCIALPRVEDLSGNRTVIEALARDYGVQLLWVEETTSVSFGEAQVQIYPPVAAGSDNASGLSVLATWQGHSALVTGDLPAISEGKLLERERLQTVEILVVGHHGSASSTSDALLAALQPKIALISVGDNQYYFPSNEVLQRLDSYHCTIYRTDQNGAVTIRFREE